MLREAAYNSILCRRLRGHHRQVAEAVESLDPDRSFDQAARLAFHYDRAALPEKALPYYVMAGDSAARLSANSEALANYGRAVELASSVELASDKLQHLYLAYGRALELTGQFGEAIENYQELERIGGERDEPALSLAGIGAQATIFSTPTARFDPDKGMKLGKEALGLAKELRDFAAEAKAFWNLMLLEFFVGEEPTQGINYGEASLALAREHDLQDQLPYTLHDLARTYTKARQFKSAIAANREARELWRARGNKAMLADNLTTASFSQFVGGRLDRAWELAEEAHQISLSIDNLWGQAFSLMRMGPIAIERGDFDRGMACLNTVLAIADEAGFTAAQLVGRGFLALHYTALGLPSMALELMKVDIAASWDIQGSTRSMARIIEIRSQLTFQGEEMEQAIEAYRNAKAEIFLGDLDYQFGPMFFNIEFELRLANANFEKVVSLSEQTIEQVRSAGMRLFMPDILRFKGQALAELGHLEQAASALAEAKEIAEAIGSRRALWPILLTWSELRSAQGDQTEAYALMREARSTLDYMIKHLSAPDLRSSFFEQPLVRRTLEG